MTIFKTRQPFRDQYIPDTIVARDEALSNLVSIFQDFVNGFQPPHLFVYGDKGTGKRTVTRHILTLAEVEVEQEIKTISIDCNEHTTLYQIYLELAYRICEQDYPRGTHQSELEEAILRRMDCPDTTWYLVLENIEALGRHNLPFDDLQQTISMYGTNQTQCGVIGISNHSRVHDYLSGDVLHRSYMSTLYLTPYDAAQLRQILELHSDEAFTENGLSDAVIPKCAAHIAQETGNATESLQLLELAGYIAHQNDADQVNEAHVDRAIESREALEVYSIFTQDLSPEEQLLCTIIAMHSEVEITNSTDNNKDIQEKEDDDKITTKELYRRYDKTVSSFGLNNVSKRRVEDFIPNLGYSGLIDVEEHNLGRKGGRWSSYDLTVPPHLIFRPAIATTARYERLFFYHDITVSDYKVDVDAFLSDDWPKQTNHKN